jgi:methyl-accepting chemotaxis protein
MMRLYSLFRRSAFRISAVTALGIAGLVWATPHAFSATAPPSSEQAKKIVALVKAAALIGTKGKTAFAEFRKQGSEWRNGYTMYLSMI